MKGNIDYVERQKLIRDMRRIRAEWNNSYALSAIDECIQAVTLQDRVDAVKVVRCQNCKHGSRIPTRKMPVDDHFICDVHKSITEYDWHCNQGEEKENDDKTKKGSK